MKITVNGKEKFFDNIISVEKLVEQLAFSAEKSVALVNGEIVEKTKWDEFKLKEGDNIELISFVGGG